MKFKTTWKANLKTQEVIDEVNDASEYAVKDVVILIANAVVKGSPVLTAHNRRSIVYKIGNSKVSMGRIKSGEKPFNEETVSVGKNEGAVYSTSGYGGYLELYHKSKAGYFRRAMEAHMGKLPSGIKARLN